MDIDILWFDNVPLNVVVGSGFIIYGLFNIIAKIREILDNDDFEPTGPFKV